MIAPPFFSALCLVRKPSFYSIHLSARKPTDAPLGSAQFGSNGLIDFRVAWRLPGEPMSSLRGPFRRAFQTFARSLDLRIGCTVTSRPHFCCRS
jgi:hypothetical protein